MTTEQTELTGEALAAEVAEKVMGWKLNKGGRSWMASRKGFQCCVAGFRPYEKIEQAWQVVDEVLNKIDGTVEWTICGLNPGSGDEAVVTFEFYSWTTGAKHSATASCVQEAICRAALKAIEANA